MQFTNDSTWTFTLIDSDGESKPLAAGETVDIEPAVARLRFLVETPGALILQVKADPVPDAATDIGGDGTLVSTGTN
jgi:hypothetical protein